MLNILVLAMPGGPPDHGQCVLIGNSIPLAPQHSLARIGAAAIKIDRGVDCADSNWAASKTFPVTPINFADFLKSTAMSCLPRGVKMAGAPPEKAL
jgi:hypothetical protein